VVAAPPYLTFLKSSSNSLLKSGIPHDFFDIEHLPITKYLQIFIINIGAESQLLRCIDNQMLLDTAPNQ